MTGAPILVWLDYLGVGLFAVSGALAAARRGGDPITFAFFAAITGIGGGTLRDIVLDAPVFWVRDPGYVAVCLAAAAFTWAAAADRRPGTGWRWRALLWLDAAGMAAYAVLGAAKAAALGVAPIVCVVMGVLTACFGGVVRDVLAGQPSVLLNREIYLTAALLGASVFVGLRMLGLPALPAEVAGIAAGFGLRAAALAWGWSLPSFQRTDGGAPPPEPPKS